MAVKNSESHSTLYFDQCGSVNLEAVITCLHRSLKHRESLRSLKLVFFTAYGEGPVMAATKLSAHQPKIIAVSFPPTYRIERDEASVRVQIPKQVERYLRALDVDIISSRLPFEGVDANTQQSSHLELIARSLAVVCSSFPMCVQAVLQACDFGLIEEGEDVIAITGDCAAIITASSTKRFLSPRSSFFLKEVICKPHVKDRPLTRPQTTAQLSRQLDDISGAPLLEAEVPHEPGR